MSSDPVHVLRQVPASVNARGQSRDHGHNCLKEQVGNRGAYASCGRPRRPSGVEGWKNYSQEALGRVSFVVGIKSYPTWLRQNARSDLTFKLLALGWEAIALTPVGCPARRVSCVSHSPHYTAVGLPTCTRLMSLFGHCVCLPRTTEK